MNDYQSRNDNVSGLFARRKDISTCGLDVVSMIGNCCRKHKFDKRVII